MITWFFKLPNKFWK